jgi:hypothetical protein
VITNRKIYKSKIFMIYMETIEYANKLADMLKKGVPERKVRRLAEHWNDENSREVSKGFINPSTIIRDNVVSNQSRIFSVVKKHICYEVCVGQSSNTIGVYEKWRKLY